VADKEIAWIERIIIARDGHRRGERYEPAENGEFAPLISARLSPSRLGKHFKLVSRTPEPHPGPIGSPERRMGPDGVREGGAVEQRPAACSAPSSRNAA
jgi:hypothetical protein